MPDNRTRRWILPRTGHGLDLVHSLRFVQRGTRQGLPVTRLRRAEKRRLLEAAGRKLQITVYRLIYIAPENVEDQPKTPCTVLSLRPPKAVVGIH